MTNEQIAHDLAVAKLSGSNLSTKELCEQYNKYFNEILKYLKSMTKEAPRTAQIIKSPI